MLKTKKPCKSCKYYYDETKTPTGIGIAYCDMKWSKRMGLHYGSLQTVVYEDGHCRDWEQKDA